MAVSAIFFLARHGSHAEVGHVLSGRSQIGLSPTGRAQAASLALKCAFYGVREIQTSPRPRARETAEEIAAQLDLEIETVAALDEIDFGSWTGRSFDDLNGDPEWRHWNERRSAACPPGGETMGAAAARIVGHLDLLAAEGRSHVLCVSHCDPIRGAIARYLGLPLDHVLRFDIDPASLSSLAIDASGGRLLRLNEVPQ